MRNEIVLDIETTGLSPENDRITEIAAVRLSDGEEFSYLVNPGISIPAKITQITGITNAMVRDAKTLKEVLSKLDAFMGENPVLIGHNVRFDYSFLKTGFLRELGKDDRFIRWTKEDLWGIDTLFLAKGLHPELPHKDLDTVTKHYGIHNNQAHRALSDTLATAAAYQAMKKECKKLDMEEPDKNWGRLFEPALLSYKAKKQEPITPKQKKYLEALLRHHGVSLMERGFSKNIEELTKSEASKAIDGIIFQYGKMY